MKLQIKCTGSGELQLSDLVPFQGDLKDLSEENYGKFKRDLLKLGFSDPFSVWSNGGKHFILDGHQRKRTLERMCSEGVELPEMFPVNFIDADDVKQAKEKVLALASQFGEITNDGLLDFCEEAQLDAKEMLDSFRFPELFKDDWKPDLDEIDKIELPGEEDSTGLVKVKCPQGQKEEVLAKVREALAGIAGIKIS